MGGGVRGRGRGGRRRVFLFELEKSKGAAKKRRAAAAKRAPLLPPSTKAAPRSRRFLSRSSLPTTPIAAPECPLISTTAFESARRGAERERRNGNPLCFFPSFSLTESSSSASSVCSGRRGRDILRRRLDENFGRGLGRRSRRSRSPVQYLGPSCGSGHGVFVDGERGREALKERKCESCERAAKKAPALSLPSLLPLRSSPTSRLFLRLSRFFRSSQYILCFHFTRRATARGRQRHSNPRQQQQQ